MDKMLTFRINSKLLEEYKKFCDENSLNMSSRIRKFMERDMENWKLQKIRKQNDQNNPK
jgi:antitoxin component of RelBE/YafQ-DinJ toxin-antitoxin module